RLAAFILDPVGGYVPGTVSGRSRMSMGRRGSMTVRPAHAVHLVPAGVVAVMPCGMAAGKTKERHRGHAGGSENDAEDVEVHLYSR
ncbi:MAG: hypothetical protein M3037_12105, partial [Gemmatimonadota bacterium]|nr:hypothetical protein [Gemmatimonadota bacterium]